MIVGNKNSLWKKATEQVSLKFTINTNLDIGTDFTIPTDGVALFNVDWGDGSVDVGNTTSVSHTYDIDGIYSIKITGTFRKFYFNNSGSKLKLVSVEQWGIVDYTLDQSLAFYGCENLNSLADDIEWLNNVTDATFMFYDFGVVTLPSTLTLNNLVAGARMFQNSDLDIIPNSVTLANLENGESMFRGLGLITTLSDSITLSKLTNGLSMFLNSTINTNRYSQLLIDIENLNPNDNVTFHGGQSSKYNASAVTARANLVSRGWVITDGGLE